LKDTDQGSLASLAAQSGMLLGYADTQHWDFWNCDHRR